MADSDAEKSIDPTPERKRKAREEGQFARSKDGSSVAASIAVLGALVALGSVWSDAFKDFSLYCFNAPAQLADTSFSGTAQQMFLVVIKTILPVSVAGAAAGTAAGFLEAGFHPNLEVLKPKWERLDPIAKLKQMFSPRQAGMSTLLSLLRVLVVSIVAYAVVTHALPDLVQLSRTSLPAAAQGALEVSLRLAFWASLVLVLMSAADYAQSYFRHQQELRMTREEFREEMKQQEGSPEVKAKRRQLARSLVNRSLAKGIREADVVIVNPTHVAVALRYRPEKGAPIVTAKGYDDVALHMRELAKQFSVPLVENVPLARALAAQVRVGRLVPVDLYAAVAEVLAFVYRLRRRGLKA